MRTLLPGDNPQAYIPGDRRRALARGEELPLRAHGAAMFVDISGFTPLTEALARELGGRRGAEELSATLDRIFCRPRRTRTISAASVIYFSGDAVTAGSTATTGSAPRRARWRCRRRWPGRCRSSTPGATRSRLGMKVAVAVGGVHAVRGRRPATSS